MAYMTAGNVGSARRALERARSQEPKHYNVRLLWAIQLALEGKRGEALREMDPEVLKYAELVFFSSNTAEFCAVLGEKNKALDWLDRAVRVGDERAEWFERNPLLKNVSDEPRFRRSWNRSVTGGSNAPNPRGDGSDRVVGHPEAIQVDG
jgi:hypothetical protein